MAEPYVIGALPKKRAEPAGVVIMRHRAAAAFFIDKPGWVRSSA
jgi:hypothetical protein